MALTGLGRFLKRASDPLGLYSEGWFGDQGADAHGGQYAGVDQSNFALPGAQERGDFLRGWGTGLAGMSAPQAQGYTAAESPFRSGQMSLIDQLQRRASGQDSLSALQLRQASDRNIAQQQALSASARPGMQAMAARQGAQNAAQIGSGLAGQQAMAGIAERQGAQDMLGNVLQGARGQDLQRALSNAQMQQQGSQFNVGAYLQQLGITTPAALEAFRQELQNAQLQQSGNADYEGNRTQRYGAALGVPSNMDRLLGGAMGGLSLLL